MYPSTEATFEFWKLGPWTNLYEVVEKKSIEPSKLLEGGSSPLNPHQPAPHLNSGMYGTIYNIHTYIVVLED